MKVATGGPQIDGIVFDVPSSSKVVVAVMDRDRGPVLRTVHPETPPRVVYSLRPRGRELCRMLTGFLRRGHPREH